MEGDATAGGDAEGEGDELRTDDLEVAAGAATRAAAPRPAAPATPVRPALSGVVGAAPLEPLVIEPIAYTPRPAGPVRVRLATLTLRPGGVYRPPTGACQDVLLYVRRGELRAVGTGVAPPQAPTMIYEGDAIRFGPEGDGLVQNVAEQPARTILAYVRRGSEPRLDDAGPSEGDGCEPPRTDDPLVRPSRSASVRTTAPSTALGGALRVHILLDADGAGARHGGLSVLEGDGAMVVPQHRHPESAEVLFIEDGSGVMLLGEQQVAVEPGAAIYVPPGVLHDFRGDGRRPLRAVQVYSPSGPEQRFR